MNSRTQRSPKSATHAPAPSSFGRQTLAPRLAGPSIPLLRQVLLPVPTGQKHPALYLHTRSGDRRVRIYIPPALHQAVRRRHRHRPSDRSGIDHVSEHNLQALLEQKQEILPARAALNGGPFAVMARFCAYVEKVFQLGSDLHPDRLSDSPQIPTAAAFASVFTLFATRRGSLNGLEQDLRVPARLRGIVGPEAPSVDSIGRIYALMDSQPLRRLLSDVAHQLKRNKALTSLEGWYLAAVDGHEFFSSRKRCCPHCQTRTVTVDGEPVTEYYHQGVVCHLIGQSWPWSWTWSCSGPARGKRPPPSDCSSGCSPLPALLRHRGRRRAVLRCAVHQLLPGPPQARDRHGQGGEPALGAGRRGVVRPAGAGPVVADKGGRTVQFWDEEGFTSCEGVKQPLRVLSHRGDGAAAGADRRAVAGDGGDDDLVVGDDADEGPVVDARAVAVRSCPLGHREQRLQRRCRRIGAWITASSTRRRRSSISC